MSSPNDNWRALLPQEVSLAFSVALENTGNRMAAKTAMIAMTTSSSIRVNPVLRTFCTPELVIRENPEGIISRKTGMSILGVTVQSW